MDDMNRPLSIK